MGEKKYPYLGKRNYKGHDYVILFTEENYGGVVMRDIEEVESLRGGKRGDFDEKMVEFLEPDKCVRLSN